MSNVDRTDAGTLERGIWKAPWVGPNGELVLPTVTSRRTLLVPPSVLTLGSDYVTTLGALWDLLDLRDPATPSEGPGHRLELVKGGAL